MALIHRIIRWVILVVVVLIGHSMIMTQASKGQAVRTPIITGLIGLHEGADCNQTHSQNYFHAQALKWTLARFNQLHFNTGSQIHLQILDTCNSASMGLRVAVQSIIGQRVTDSTNCQDNDHLGFLISPNQAPIQQLIKALNIYAWELPMPRDDNTSQLRATLDLLSALYWKSVLLVTSNASSASKFANLATTHGVCIASQAIFPRNSSLEAHLRLLDYLGKDKRVAVLIGSRISINKTLHAASTQGLQSKFIIVPESDFAMPSHLTLDTILVTPALNRVRELEAYSKFNHGVTTTIRFILQLILTSLPRLSNSTSYSNLLAPSQELTDTETETVLYTAFGENVHLIQSWSNGSYVTVGNVSYQALKLNKAFQSSIETISCVNCSCVNLIQMSTWKLLTEPWVLPMFSITIVNLLVVMVILALFAWKRGLCQEIYFLVLSSTLLASASPYYFQSNTILCIAQPLLSSSILNFFLSALLARAITVITKPQKYRIVFQGLLLLLLLVLNIIYTSCLVSWDQITQAFHNNVALSHCNDNYFLAYFADDLVLLLLLLMCCPIVTENHRLTGVQIGSSTYSVAVGSLTGLSLHVLLCTIVQDYHHHQQQHHFLFIIITNFIVGMTYAAIIMSSFIATLLDRTQAQSQINLVNSEHVPNIIGTTHM